MAIPKSANERIRRKIRKKKVEPKGRDDTGRVVVKKTANNDPNRNNRNRNSKKRKVSEDFLKWYRGGNVDNPNRFEKLLEDLITVAVEAGGEIPFPLELSRLVELKESIDDEVPFVIIQNKNVPVKVHVCPICNEEILEKTTHLPEDQRGSDYPEWRHSCGGRFRYPPVNKDDIIRRLKGVGGD